MNSFPIGDIYLLFENLAERLHNENNLSDITYAFLETNNEFRCYFLRILFPNLKVSDIKNIQRELATDDSRPDFIIDTEKQNYLIEIKINDKHHHLKQYIKTYPDYERAYITNYLLSNEKNEYKNDYKFITWKEIYNYLKKINRKRKNLFIDCYSRYLKNTCGFIEVKDMRFKNLSNLAQFNSWVNELVNDSYDTLKTEVYNTKYNFNDNCSGKYFKLSKQNSKKFVYPWFGVTYDIDSTFIAFEFDYAEGWCQLLQKYKSEIKAECVRRYLFDDSEKDYFTISLNKTKYDKLQNESDIEKQQKIIKQFFKDIIEIVGVYL